MGAWRKGEGGEGGGSLCCQLNAAGIFIPGCCRVDLHTQKADKAEVSDEEKARSSRTREAAQELFLSPMMSVWIIASRLFPFLLPLIRRFAHRYPDRALVGVWKPTSPSVFLGSRKLFCGLRVTSRRRRCGMESLFLAPRFRSACAMSIQLGTYGPRMVHTPIPISIAKERVWAFHMR